METKSIIKSLNLTDGDVLTLEKAKDRMEFEALPIMDINKGICSGINVCYCGSECGVYLACHPLT